MVLLAAFQVVLFKYTGQEDISIGSPIAGRDHPDLEAIIGYFANLLVLRTPIEITSSFRQMVRKVRETTLDAYAHHNVPFETW